MAAHVDEGYIRYICNLKVTSPVPAEKLGHIIQWRQHLYSLGLIGASSDGIGYGNISIRDGATDDFIITGSSTGNKEEIDASCFSLVTKVDIQNNTVWCQGPIKASSEAMTHASIYMEKPGVGAVVHTHNSRLWSEKKGVSPTTDEEAEFGTPRLAQSIRRILRSEGSGDEGMIILGGHKDGMITYAQTIGRAVEILENEFNTLTD